MISPRRALVAALAVAMLLATLGAASASPDIASRIAASMSDARAPRRGASGASYTTLSSRRFRVDGSPYEWSFEASQYRSGPGVPPEEPNLRIVAARTGTAGNHPFQVHAWEFDLAAGSLQFNGELRRVGLDTGLIPAFGAIFMDLEDLSAMSSSRSRCPSTGDVLSNRSARTGVLRGSMTFFPGYADPQMPDEVSITHVRARIERTRYTGNDCVYPNRCEPGKTLTSMQVTGPGVGYLVNAGTVGRDEGLAFQQYEVVGVATVMHLVVAYGPDDVLGLSPTTVEVRSDVAAPFIAPGGALAWTKGTKTIDQTRKCRRTEWELSTPSGSFDLQLDSGDETIATPASATYEVERRR